MDLLFLSETWQRKGKSLPDIQVRILEQFEVDFVEFLCNDFHTCVKQNTQSSSCLLASTLNFFVTTFFGSSIKPSLRSKLTNDPQLWNLPLT